MACPRILDLATEIIYEICNHLGDSHNGRSELCRLRAVCRHLNERVEVKLFSRITVNVALHGADTAAAQLQALASGTCCASNFAKTVQIRSLHPVPHDPQPSVLKDVVAMMQVRKNLRGAIMSLKNVTNVSWCIVRGDKKWAIGTVMESLSFLPSLTDFRLSCGHRLGFVLPLHLLSGLRSITISGECGDFRENVVLPLAQAIAYSPELSYLDVDSRVRWHDKSTPSLHDLLGNNTGGRGLPLRHLSLSSWDLSLDNVPLSHFKSLTSFTFCIYSGYLETTNNRPLWKAFLAEGISLEELSVDEISGELMDFIASFTGLRRLTLLRLDLKSRETSDDIADMFFRHVLPVHCSTLHSLYLDPSYEGKWCFSGINAAAILDCQKLSDLSIALQWEDYDAENNQRSPVHLLLNHAVELLELRCLHITIAYSNAIRGAKCGNTGMGYAHYMRGQIRDHVMAFAPVDPAIHLPEIIAGGQVYKIAQNQEGEYHYHLSLDQDLWID